ncbi:hypothetical protein J7E83_19035 [Arthrobacter sp. ISL-48]|uniref:hypothetical protein n=1 Tax=Arthrobacter sp. ISL-48 TaxID=2819110 RepID=UPI001BE80C7E|nr:hypothetical protein [Arthrobacter sp. ISL-48]MBT2534181.1 hypothetical protein [Arthrobacter sp. ISL-48]
MTKIKDQTVNIHDTMVPTVAVGALQIGRLKRHWSEYCSATDPDNGPIDLVEALNRTGALLHAVGDVITSEQIGDHSVP